MKFVRNFLSRRTGHRPFGFAAALAGAIIVSMPDVIAQSLEKSNKSREEAAVDLFGETCLEKRTLVYMQDLARKRSWRELANEELAAYRPVAKRVDQVNGWELTIASVPFRLYMSRGSIETKVIADIPNFANANEFQCRIVTRQALSHDILSAVIAKAFGRKPDGDFSQPGVTRLHQWGGSSDKEALFINLITNVAGSGATLIVRWYDKP